MTGTPHVLPHLPGYPASFLTAANSQEKECLFVAQNMSSAVRQALTQLSRTEIVLRYT